MVFSSVLSVSVGAAAGALLRWWLGSMLNPIFPSIPFGTLAANLIGGFLMGCFLGLIRIHPFFPEALRLSIVTGFLGGLTTFSTFSGETVNLLFHQEYWLSISIIFLHVAGSISATIFGVYTIKFIFA